MADLKVELLGKALGAEEGSSVLLSHPPPLASDSYLRRKVYGGELAASEIELIISEVAQR